MPAKPGLAAKPAISACRRAAIPSGRRCRRFKSCHPDHRLAYDLARCRRSPDGIYEGKEAASEQRESSPPHAHGRALRNTRMGVYECCRLFGNEAAPAFLRRLISTSYRNRLARSACRLPEPQRLRVPCRRGPEGSLLCPGILPWRADRKLGRAGHLSRRAHCRARPGDLAGESA